MEAAVTKFIDILPAGEGARKVDILSGWPIKAIITVAAVETFLSLGSWARFGWTLVAELVVVMAGLWMNRNGMQSSYVWGAVLASILVGPLARRFTGGPWALW